MKANEIVYPVVCFDGPAAWKVENADAMTMAWKSAFKGGLFNEMKVVDSNGGELVVIVARNLGGVGFLWGFTIFLNQRIRVELELIETGHRYSLEDLRKKLLKGARITDASRGDYEDWRKKVREASSFRSLIDLFE